MRINLFIDSNIFLDFYRYATDDLKELEKLVVLLNSDKVVLHLPQQVINEVKRNRENVISESKKSFDEMKITGKYPAIYKNYEEYEKIIGLSGAINETRQELSSKVLSDIKTRSLKADRVIDELFNNARKYSCEKAFIVKAEERQSLGNPPGNNDSLCDSLIWECLLSGVKGNVDLYFISGDSHWQSPVEKKEFNSVLQDEWGETKKAKIRYYRQISHFFKDNIPEIKIQEESQKEKLINELKESASYQTTHLIIGKLAQFRSFSSSQTDRLVNILLSNMQVGEIASDYDVQSFYVGLLDDILFMCDEDIKAKMIDLYPQLKGKEEVPF